MRKLFALTLIVIIGSIGIVYGQQTFETDIIKTKKDDVVISFIGHGSLMFTWNNKIIHIDPSSREADYSQLPKADVIFITHHHGDHCDPKALSAISKDQTTTYLTGLANESWKKGKVLVPGETVDLDRMKVEVLPAYNLIHKRDNGDPYHEKGKCNSYLITIDGKRFFIGGDTENTPEMKALKNIDVAFLPMNLPYTMTPEMVTDAVKAFKPKVFYPYHYGNSDLNHLKSLLSNEKSVDLRIRKM